MAPVSPDSTILASEPFAQEPDRVATTDPATDRRWPGAGGVVAVLGVLAVLALPLAAAVLALRTQEWFPTLDMAMTELRVRDVGSARPPLIGLPGRIGTLQEQGSHPGPISFWALWPFYQLFGAGSWALEAAAACLHLAAMGAALALAHRRGGPPLVVGVGLLLAVLARAYGAGTLVEAWNPYLPVLWWVVFLLAVWSLLERDVAVLPVAVVAGTFCMQTHSPYVGTVAGLGALGVAGMVLALRRAGPDGGAERRRAWTWVGVAGVVAVVLWLPPVLDQLFRTPGNLTLLWDHFGSPPDEPVGLGMGARLVVAHLDPSALVRGDLPAFGTQVTPDDTSAAALAPGVGLLLAWAASVVVAVRLGHRSLLRLHLVLGAAMLLAAVSIGRIFGSLWYYLMMWAWGLTALVLASVVWTAAVLVARRRPEVHAHLATVALGGVLVITSVAFTTTATDVDVPARRLSETLADLIPPTVTALTDVAPPSAGGKVLVTWSDVLSIGSQGFAIVNELERRGFEVGVPPSYRVGTADRVLAAGDAAAVVQFATGYHVERIRAIPAFQEVAFVDPRSAAEREEYERLRAQVIAAIQRAGHPDFASIVDRNLFAATVDTRVPVESQPLIARMLDLGLPAAMFIGPPEAAELAASPFLR